MPYLLWMSFIWFWLVVCEDLHSSRTKRFVGNNCFLFSNLKCSESWKESKQTFFWWMSANLVQPLILRLDIDNAFYLGHVKNRPEHCERCAAYAPFYLCSYERMYVNNPIWTQSTWKVSDCARSDPRLRFTTITQRKVFT